MVIKHIQVQSFTNIVRRVWIVQTHEKMTKPHFLNDYGRGHITAHNYTFKDDVKSN